MCLLANDEAHIYTPGFSINKSMDIYLLGPRDGDRDGGGRRKRERDWRNWIMFKNKNLAGKWSVVFHPRFITLFLIIKKQVVTKNIQMIS